MKTDENIQPKKFCPELNSSALWWLILMHSKIIFLRTSSNIFNTSVRSWDHNSSLRSIMYTPGVIILIIIHESKTEYYCSCLLNAIRSQGVNLLYMVMIDETTPSNSLIKLRKNFETHFFKSYSNSRINKIKSSIFMPNL